MNLEKVAESKENRSKSQNKRAINKKHKKKNIWDLKETFFTNYDNVNVN